MEPYHHTLKRDEPFTFETLFSHPGDLRKWDKPGNRKKVCVIGAGIAGLVAAYELYSLGHDVTVLESSSRIGGRIRTHHFSNGSHGEIGAMRIPVTHKCVLHYVEKFNLPTRRFVNQNLNAYYFLRGVKTRLRDWKKLESVFELDGVVQRNPLKLYESLMRVAMESVSSQEKWEMFASSLTSHRLLEYDSISLWQYLARSLTKEAIEYVGHATGMIQYERASFLETLIDYFGLFRVDQIELSNGMESLPKALAVTLTDYIHLWTTVKGITCTPMGVLVSWNDKERKNIQLFDFVICTAPAPAVMRIVFDPPLDAHKSQALRIKYASAAKTIVATSSRFWELQDGIYGGGSFTDLPIQQMWYPSDNAIPETDPEDYFYTGNENDPYILASKDWKGSSKEVSYAPSCFIASYSWEANTERFLAIAKENRTEAILADVEKVHPSVREYAEDVVHHSWNEEESPGGGCFAFFAPGEHVRYQNALCTPYPKDRPRVFFAGEHLSIAHAWVQGAVQTAINAVIAILQQETRA